jgi:hypothetical protein
MWINDAHAILNCGKILRLCERDGISKPLFINDIQIHSVGSSLARIEDQRLHSGAVD